MARKPAEKEKRAYVRYSARLAERIIDDLSTGKQLTEIVAEPGMPDRHTIRRWCIERSEFAARYETARRWSAYALLDEIADLVDRGQAIVAAAVNPNAAASVLREQINVKRWMVGKLLPQYGDSSKVEVTGASGTPLIPPRSDPPTAEARTKLALALLNVLRGDDPLPERALPAPEPPPQTIEHEPAPRPSGSSSMSRCGHERERRTTDRAARQARRLA